MSTMGETNLDNIDEVIKLQALAISRHRLKIDGTGVTTLIGLAGCPLDCEYCLNYEILHKKEPKSISGISLIKHIMQDYCYFVATGGGITFGGGEPLLQYKAIAKVIERLPPNIAVNIETSLNVPKLNLEILVDKIAEWIIDIKDLSTDIYKAYTGKSVEQVMENLEYFRDLGMQSKCTIRVPLIPGYNTDKDRDNTVKKLHNLGYKNIDLFDYKTDTGKGKGQL